jgi:hypothetical protein
MLIAKPIAIVSSPAVAGAWSGRARVEKASQSNRFDGERHSAPQDGDFASAKLARTQLSRNETADVEPDRDDQRLVPAFVTQLLAQVMNGGYGQPASAASAYRNRAPQIALVCDRDI